MDPIVLKTQAHSLAFWKDFHINSSMLNGAPQFYLQTDFGQPNNWNIKNDMPCTLEVYGNKVLDGSLEMMNIKVFTNGQPTIEIEGYDKTRLLSDCSYGGIASEWKGQTILQLIKNICSYFSIDVMVDPSASSLVNGIVPTFRMYEGQRAMYHISGLCYLANVIPFCKGDGKLTLTRAGSLLSMDSIEVGANASSASIYCANKGRYSHYTIKGQGISDDAKSISDWAQIKGEFYDTAMASKRPVVYLADMILDSGKARNYAAWTAMIQAGLSRRHVYTVKGWTQSDGKTLWTVNTLVRVKNDVINFNGTMLIADVDYLLDGKSEQSLITVVDKNMFSTSGQIPKSGLFDA